MTYTAIALPSQFVVGWFADKLPKPPVIFVFLLLQAASIMIDEVWEVISRSSNYPEWWSKVFLRAELLGETEELPSVDV